MLSAASLRFLLDTNIVIALFAQEAAVLQQLSQALEVFVPSIVLGELAARGVCAVEEIKVRDEDAAFTPPSEMKLLRMAKAGSLALSGVAVSERWKPSGLRVQKGFAERNTSVPHRPGDACSTVFVECEAELLSAKLFVIITNAFAIAETWRPRTLSNLPKRIQ